MKSTLDKLKCQYFVPFTPTVKTEKGSERSIFCFLYRNFIYWYLDNVVGLFIPMSGRKETFNVK